MDRDDEEELESDINSPASVAPPDEGEDKNEFEGKSANGCLVLYQYLTQNAQYSFNGGLDAKGRDICKTRV
jgi:hypothetical protein